MGNACVLKPAEEACLTALAFADLARQAGFPDGAVNVVPGLGAEAGAALTAHPGIGHISFTGSVATGRLVQAAAAQNVIPVTLELGGKSPQLFFADADLDAALPFLVNAGLQNAGQTCSASSRILVERARLNEVADRMAGAYRAKITAPAMADRDLGPLISARQKKIVEGYLDLAGQGQRIAEGQIAPDAPEGGHYVAPVLLAGVAPEDRLAQEEIFWPRAGPDPLRRRRPRRLHRQWHGIRACRQRLVRRRRTADAARETPPRGAGVSEQLRRGGGRGASFRRDRAFGPWPGKGVRGALRVFQSQDGGGASRLTGRDGAIGGFALFGER